MKRLLSYSIRTQIFLIAFIVAVPAACIIIYSGILMREEAMNDARMATLRLADVIAAEQQNLVAAAHQEIITLAQLPDVKRQNASMVQRILTDILALNTQFSNIFLADMSGRVWASAVPLLLNQNISDRRYFKNAVASGRLSSGEYVISRATARPAFNVAASLKNEHGHTIGAICVGIKLNAYKQALERSKLPSGTSFILLDYRGVVLYRPISPEEYVGRQFNAAQFKSMQDGPDEDTLVDVTGIRGDKRVVTYRKLRLSGEPSPYMYIRVGIPIATSLAEANKMLLRNLVILTAFLVLAVSFSWLIGTRSIADRITALENATRNLAEGDRHARVSDLVRGGELGRLGQTFDAMALKLSMREQALVESERNYREIFNATKDCIFVYDAESGKIIEVNKGAEELYGYPRPEILNASFDEIVCGEPPYSIQDMHRWIRKVLQEGPQSFEWLSRRKTGESFWTEMMLTTTSIGGAGRVLAVVRDITERKKTEEEQQKLVSLIEMSRDFISIKDLDGRILYTNAAGLKLVGLDTLGESLGKPIQDFLMKADHRRLEAEIMPAIMSAGTWIGELALRHFKTGASIPVEMSAFIIRDTRSGKPIALANISRDITERKHAEDENKRLQSQLLHIQKMESIGQLAGGIAHDFNNILAAIIGYGNVMQLKLGADDENRIFVDHILASAERAASLTQSLLAFSRKQIIDPRNVNVNDIINKVERLLSRIIGEDITLTTSLSRGVLTIFVDPTQVEQMLMNLATNARDAMPAGGKLVIETSRVELDHAGAVTQGLGKAGPYAVITVRDTGSGIDDSMKDKIFEPFFTTKEAGKGTGLGLSIVYGIVKQNNGHIIVSSEHEKGTVFTIYLPLVNIRAEDTALSGKTALKPIQGGRETVLLAEDNESVRKLTHAILSEFGYTVIDARDGDQAIRVFLENKDTVDLLLIDVIMPGKNGREVYEAAKKIRPGLKVIFTSGYPSDLIQKEGVLEQGFHFLSKPSTPRDIITKVREVLDE